MIAVYFAIGLAIGIWATPPADSDYWAVTIPMITLLWPIAIVITVFFWVVVKASDMRGAR